MKTKSCCRRWQSARGSRSLAACLVAAVLLAWTAPVSAGVPKWLRGLAHVSLPDYSEDTDAVMLLDEKVTTVEDNGKINTRYRRAYKILRPQGRKHGLVVVYIDNETQLTSLKAWSISAQGKEYDR